MHCTTYICMIVYVVKQQIGSSVYSSWQLGYFTTNALLDQKSLGQKIHRLRSTATNNIVKENQDHRGGLNIGGQGRGTRVAGARGRGKVPARRDCIYCRKSFQHNIKSIILKTSAEMPILKP